MKPVPNEYPKSSTCKIAIVGEAPGETEEKTGLPFVGRSGDLLFQIMSRAGVSRRDCFVGNVCQYRPPGNDVLKARPEWIEEGCDILRKDLEKVKPNVCILLGGSALKAAGDMRPITSLRGSVFLCENKDSPFYGFKCIATYHPAAVLRVYSWMNLFIFDLKRGIKEAESPKVVKRKRTYLVGLTADGIIKLLNEASQKTTPVALDLEGGIKQGITCFSVSTEPGFAFIVNHLDFNEVDGARILEASKCFLESPVPKVLQNGLYDQFVFSYLWGVRINNIIGDTMFAEWELDPESQKGLDVLASVYTDVIYYKDQRTLPSSQVHYNYCCTDSDVTLEIHEKQQELLKGKQREHYEFNVQLMKPFSYISLKGIRYDVAGARAALERVLLNKSMRQTRLEAQIKKPINLNSHVQCKKLLYDTLGLKKRFKGRGESKTLTSDDLTFLHAYIKTGNPILLECLYIKALESLRKQYSFTTDPDGRIRASFNLVGTPTARLSCSGSGTDCTANLQTVMKQAKPFYLADEGCLISQCDLSGADGWTVAAHCARLGDNVMMDDYLAGVKPARFIAAQYLENQKPIREQRNFAKLSSQELLAVIAEFDLPKWLYNAAKATQHGSNYMMKENTMADNIIRQSWKKAGEVVTDATPKVCRQLQRIYFSRYEGVKRWHDWIEKQVVEKGYLETSYGFKRHFHGRRRSPETIRSACAHEPQANTTYATNRFLYNLWSDPLNRRDGQLIIFPQHQVHDAAVVGFKEDDLELAKELVPKWFDFSIMIADIEIKIPYEGGVGPSWGDQSLTVI